MFFSACLLLTQVLPAVMATWKCLSHTDILVTVPKSVSEGAVLDGCAQPQNGFLYASLFWANLYHLKA